MNLKFTQYILAGALGSLLLLSNSTFAQYGRTDSLRGGLGPERSWWDLKHYDLSVEIIPSKKYIKGSNKISYQVVNEAKLLQLDLQEPLAVTSITQGGEQLSFRREGAVYWVTLTKKQVPGAIEALVVKYEGGSKRGCSPTLGWWNYLAEGFKRARFYRIFQSRHWIQHLVATQGPSSR